MCIPFGLLPVAPTGTSLVKLMLSTASTYPYVSVNAYNLWALFPVDGQSMATNSAWVFDAPAKDAVSWAAFGPIPAGLVGAFLLLAIAAVVAVLVARRPDRLTILVGTSASSPSRSSRSPPASTSGTCSRCSAWPRS